MSQVSKASSKASSRSRRSPSNSPSVTPSIRSSVTASVKGQTSTHTASLPTTSESNVVANHSGATFPPVPDVETKLSLVQVQVIFRHGTRSPLHMQEGMPEVDYPVTLMEVLRETDFPYCLVDYYTGKPKDPPERSNHHPLKGGCTVGTLTTIGQHEMFRLGSMIRNRYAKPLGLTSYSSELMKIRSSYVVRTIRSLCCVLAGIFGTEHLTSVSPVAVPVKNPNVEDIYPNLFNCPSIFNAYNKLWTELDNDPVVRKLLETLQPLLDYPSTMNVLSINDNMRAGIAHGFQYPTELIAYKEEVEQSSASILHALTTCAKGKQDFTCFTLGTFMHDILKEMVDVVGPQLSTKKHICNCTLCNKKPTSTSLMNPSPKLFLYSAHDSTLTVLYHALGIWKNEWPVFASNVTLELYKDNSTGAYFVRTLLCGQVVRTRGATEDVVPFKVFYNNLSPFTMTHEDRRKKCMVQKLTCWDRCKRRLSKTCQILMCRKPGKNDSEVILYPKRGRVNSLTCEKKKQKQKHHHKKH